VQRPRIKRIENQIGLWIEKLSDELPIFGIINDDFFIPCFQMLNYDADEIRFACTAGTANKEVPGFITLRNFDCV